MLERVFAARQEATLHALRPVHGWCESGDDADGLRRALTDAVGGYMEFLIARPSFARLIAREELAGAARLRETTRGSDALERAFAAVKAVARRRGLRSFAVDDAVLLFVSLAYTPAAHRETLMASIGRDLDDPKDRRRQVRLAVDQLMHLIAG